MKFSLPVVAAALCGATLASAQNQPNQPIPQRAPAPIFSVNVVERTVKAVDYRYRSIPTPVDFRGTVLMPEAKGMAMVESHKGTTEINANLEKLRLPQQYGREYLTYVLWAITPEGRPHNLGELVPDHSNNAHIHATTDLQAFALIVTAEPYSAVRQPSDVVVLENQVRPDTEGKIETVNAKYELMPRGQYTYNQTSGLSGELAGLPKVSQREYETLTELYQAENAVGIAVAAGAQQYAEDTLARAQQLLRQAQQMHTARRESNRVIEIARQAAQTAEDARLIAMQRKNQSGLAEAQADAAKARQETAAAQAAAAQAQAQADEQVRQAKIQTDAAVQRANELQQQVDSERQTALRAQRDANTARTRQEELPAAPPPPLQAGAQADAPRQSTLRVRMLNDLGNLLPTTDTPRGLVVTLRDSDFSGDALRPAAADKLARVSAIVGRQPGLTVRVEGYSDTAARQSAAELRADMVSRALARDGVTNPISAVGLGDSRPLGPPGEENSRVEIVISGAPIGSVPTWDRTYSLR